MASKKVDDGIPSGTLHRHLGIGKQMARAWRQKGVLPPIFHCGPKSYYRRIDLMRLINAELSRRRQQLRMLARDFLKLKRT